MSARDGVLLTTGTTALLNLAAHERHAMSTVVVSAALELLLLALWVLAGLVVRSMEARQSEIRLARLRGFPLPSVINVAIAEPGVLCLLGLPIGIAAGWIFVDAYGQGLFARGTAVSADGWLWVSVAAAATCVAVLLAAGAARAYRSTSLVESTERGLRQRLGTTWRSRSSTLADLAIVSVTVAVLVELEESGAFSSGRSDPLAAAGPGLVALGIAVVGAQLVLLAARGATRLTAGSNRVGLYLAARNISRRPILVRQARGLMVALCLAIYASAAWSISGSNRDNLASFQVGAAAVADVTVPAGANLQELVTDVDPTGRFAMAASEVVTAQYERDRCRSVPVGSRDLLARGHQRGLSGAHREDPVAGRCASRNLHRRRYLGGRNHVGFGRGARRRRRRARRQGLQRDRTGGGGRSTRESPARIGCVRRLSGGRLPDPLPVRRVERRADSHHRAQGSHRRRHDGLRYGYVEPASVRPVATVWGRSDRQPLGRPNLRGPGGPGSVGPDSKGFRGGNGFAPPGLRLFRCAHGGAGDPAPGYSSGDSHGGHPYRGRRR